MQHRVYFAFCKLKTNVILFLTVIQQSPFSVVYRKSMFHITNYKIFICDFLY